MKKSRFTESQIVAILKQTDGGRKVAEVCGEHGISQPTYYNWKSKSGGLEVSELRRTKELEAEQAKLNRMYAELAMENLRCPRAGWYRPSRSRRVGDEESDRPAQ